MHDLCIFWFFFCSKIIFDQKPFSYCWDEFDYPGSIVYLSCWAWNWNTARIPTIRDQNKVTNITEKKISKTLLKFQDICCSCVFCVHMFQKSLSPKKLSLRFGYNYFHPCLNPWITLNNLPLFFDFHSNY